jgi:hypothetical protein
MRVESDKNTIFFLFFSLQEQKIRVSFGHGLSLHAPQVYKFRIKGHGQRRLEWIFWSLGYAVVKVMFIVIGVDQLATHVLID